MQLDILKFVQGFRTPLFDHFFELVTATAEETLLMLMAAVLIWCLAKDIGYRLGFAFISGNAMNICLKFTFHTARPIGVEGIESIRIETAGGYSFPSGHTQSATTFWSVVMMSFKKKFLYIVGTLVFLIVGFSRMYLGVHWPVDVIGGIIIGIAWAVLVNKLYDYAKKANKPELFLMLLIPMLIGLLFYKDDGYVKACGGFIGFFAGYIIESKYVQYDTRARLPIQLAKLVIGLAVLLALKSGVKLLLPASMISDFFRYGLMALWVTAGAPYIFKKLFGAKYIPIEENTSYKA